jgi:hypothetical protein
MLDDLRRQAQESSFTEDEQQQSDDDIFHGRPPAPRHFLGLTPLQRLILSSMVLMMTCILGVSFLLITQKMMP